MKRWICAVLCVLCILAGCASREPTMYDAQAHTATENARAECYKAMAEKRKMPDLSAVDPAQQGLVMLAMAQNQTMETVVMALAKDGYDPCGATNLFDSQIAEVKAKNEPINRFWSTLGNVTPWVVGAILGSKALDSAGDTYNAGQDLTSGANSGNINNGMKTQNDMMDSPNGNISDDPILSPVEIDYGDGSSNDLNTIGPESPATGPQ